ncbi:MAG TPA: TetR/AcrR family transcriptional regulator [Actinopolymorphaceae bacterium]
MTDTADQQDPSPEPEIPPALATAWGVRPRPGKGPKPGLSVGRIVQAATQTALKEGLSAVSMNRVAAEVGTAAMSLYRYVSGKDELLTLMVDAAFGPPPDIPEPDDDWRSGLARWARLMLERMRQNLWAVRVPISGPPTTPNQVAWLERGLRCLTGTPLDPGEKMSIMLLVSGIVRSEAQLDAQLADVYKSSGPVGDAAMTEYSRILAALADRERFPALHEILDSGVLSQADESGEDFDFALERVLDGIQTYITRSSTESRTS